MAQWVKVMPPSLMTWLWSLRTPEGLHQKSGFNDPGRAKDVQRDTVPLPLADRLLKQWSPRNWNFLGNLILRERKVWRLVPARAGTCLLERLHSADHSPEDLEGKRWVGQGWQGQGCSWTASIWRLPVSYFNLNLKSRHRAKSLGGGGVSTGLFICSCPQWQHRTHHTFLCSSLLLQSNWHTEGEWVAEPNKPGTRAWALTLTTRVTDQWPHKPAAK